MSSESIGVTLLRGRNQMTDHQWSQWLKANKITPKRARMLMKNAQTASALSARLTSQQ